MFTLQEFGELRYLWLIYDMELRRSLYIEEDGNRMLTNVNPERVRYLYNKLIAVDSALKCLIASHPAEVFNAFVCPTVFVHHRDDLTRHDSA